MPLSSHPDDQWFTIGSSVTALSTTLQTFTGATKDLKAGGPRKGYDLTTRIGSVYTGAVNTAATLATSRVSYTILVDTSDDSAFATTALQVVYPPIPVAWVLPTSATTTLTAGARNTQRISTQFRYARVRIVTPSAPGLTAAMVTSVMEAILGQSTPA